MDCSPPDFSVHGISQARILEWVAISSSRGSSHPRDWMQVYCIAVGFFTNWATRKALVWTWEIHKYWLTKWLGRKNKDWEVPSQIPGIHPLSYLVLPAGLKQASWDGRQLSLVHAGVCYIFKTLNYLLPMVHNLAFMLLPKSFILLLINLLVMAIWSTFGGWPDKCCWKSPTLEKCIQEEQAGL